MGVLEDAHSWRWSHPVSRSQKAVVRRDLDTRRAWPKRPAAKIRFLSREHLCYSYEPSLASLDLNPRLSQEPLLSIYPSGSRSSNSARAKRAAEEVWVEENRGTFWKLFGVGWRHHDNRDTGCFSRWVHWSWLLREGAPPRSAYDLSPSHDRTKLRLCSIAHGDSCFVYLVVHDHPKTAYVLISTLFAGIIVRSVRQRRDHRSLRREPRDQG